MESLQYQGTPAGCNSYQQQQRRGKVYRNAKGRVFSFRLCNSVLPSCQIIRQSCVTDEVVIIIQDRWTNAWSTGHCIFIMHVEFFYCILLLFKLLSTIVVASKHDIISLSVFADYAQELIRNTSLRILF